MRPLPSSSSLLMPGHLCPPRRGVGRQGVTGHGSRPGSWGSGECRCAAALPLLHLLPPSTLQARADLLLADAAAAKVSSWASVTDESVAARIADAAGAAQAEQRFRYKAALRFLADPSNAALARPPGPAGGAAAAAPAGATAAGATAAAATPAKSGKDASAALATASDAANAPAPSNAGSAAPSFVPCSPWWEQAGPDDTAGGGSSAEDTAGEDEASADADRGASGEAALALRPTGAVPGLKPIPTDPAALGLIVPGCSVGVLRWKARVISALARAMKRGVALGAAWLVESAAKRLWNRHLHVWSANEYSLAVLPLLLWAAADALSCLATVGSTASELCTKLGAAVARAHEESA